MELPLELNQKIIQFLTSLPNIHDSNSRSALIYSASLDERLQNMINASGAPAQFFPQLVPILLNYGKLRDGRDALEAVLGAAKNSVGQEKRAYCDALIRELRSVHSHSQRNDVDDSANQQDNKSSKTESPDARILRILYAYYQGHSGDPEMSVDELRSKIPESDIATIQSELFSLKKKGWIDYDLTSSGTAGLVWIEPKGIKIAKQFS